jgi:hypothetical protein
MHRSGTSALTRLVHLQGAVLPATLMPPQADNPDGFWESLPVVEFNNRLLQEVGRAWDDPRPIDWAWWTRPAQRRRWIDEARQLLLREFPEGELIVLKDPRIGRLLPVWLEACEEAGFAPVVLLCCRNPLEVAASLAQRNGLDTRQATLLWLGYMLDAEAASRGLPRALVPFADLLDDWRVPLAQAYEAIGLEPPALDGGPADAIDGVLDAGKRHHHVTTDQVLRNEALSPLLKDAWVALQTRPLPAEETFRRLRERWTEAWATLAPHGAPATADASEDSDRVVPGLFRQGGTSAPRLHRHIIVHYHLFKNAGTSLDSILKHNFGKGWREHEGPGPGWPAADVTAYLGQHPDIVVLSSHTALLPAPRLAHATTYPVIFVRHPLDRIRSIYEFERKQRADTEGARRAKETDMGGYIAWRLNRAGDRSLRDFQSYRLAFAVPEVVDGTKLDEAARALKAIETLPFVGLVERFDASLTRLEDWLRPVFPHIDFKPTRANVTQRGESSLEQRLDAMRDEIGAALYDELLAVNQVDLGVFECLLQRGD